MSILRRPTLSSVVVSGLLLISFAGCASAPPPPPEAATKPAPAPATAAPAKPQPAVPPKEGLTLDAAAVARPDLMASFTIPSLDRSLTSAAALARHVMPLPMDGPALRQMLFERLGLPPALAVDVDSAVPVAAALVTLGVGKDPGLALAVAAKSPEAAMRIVSSGGRIIARRGEAVQLEFTPGGKSWIWRFGNVLLMADTVDALKRGGMLAMESRRETPEDLLVVLYPDSIARNSGTDVKTAVSRWLEETKTHGDVRPETLEGITARLADMSRAELGVTLDTAQGLSLLGRMFARPTTKLADIAKDARPFALDPSVVAGDEPVMVMASSYGSTLRDQVAILRNRLQAGQNAKGMAEVMRIAESLIETTTGQLSAAVRLKPALVAEGVYALKDAPAAARLQEALNGLTKVGAETFWQAETNVKARASATVKTEKVGALKARHVTFQIDSAGMTPEEQKSINEWLGGPKLDVYMAVAGTRLLVTGGNDGRARLSSLASLPKEKGVSGPLTAALAGVQGRDGFMYLDLARMLSGIAARSKDKSPSTDAMKNLTARIPLLGSYWGDGKGEKLSGVVTVSTAALDGIGAVIPVIVGVGGGM